MAGTIRKVNVVGHQHPDTDSICSAISYAYLKSQVDPDTEYEARRAGAINRETAFVLQHFGFEEPRLITTATPQMKDVNYNKAGAIDRETSLYRAWNLMRDDRTSTLCIADEDGNLEGLIAVKDVKTAGEYVAVVKLHKEVTAQVPFTVTVEMDKPEVTEEAPEEKKPRKARREETPEEEAPVAEEVPAEEAEAPAVEEKTEE